MSNLNYKINKYKTKFLNSKDNIKEFTYIAKFLQYKLVSLQNQTGGGIVEQITSLVDLVNATNKRLDNFIRIKNILNKHYDILRSFYVPDQDLVEQLSLAPPYKKEDNLEEYVNNITTQIQSSNIL